MKDVPGAYILIIENERSENIEIGSLGVVLFPKGKYAYVGSARSGIMRRTRRYFLGPEKVKWHIDYLIRAPSFRVLCVLAVPGGEEGEIVKMLRGKFPCVDGFGSTDDRENRSHLFYIGEAGEEELASILSNAGLEYEIVKTLDADDC